MDLFLELLMKGGPYALCLVLAIAVRVLWKDKKNQEENQTKNADKSTERHRERDNKFEELQEKSIEAMTQCSTLMQIIVSRGAGGNG